MRLTERQKEITDIVRENGPITGEQIAERLHVTRSALRGDLAVLLSGEIIAARRRITTLEAERIRQLWKYGNVLQQSACQNRLLYR